MSHFDINLKGRAFIAVIQENNMKAMGMTEEEYKNPEYLADFLMMLWNDSGKGRTSAVAVCESENGLYHAHMALYGNTTTLKNVANILYKSHVEPQLGGKKELAAYLLKEGKYAEKNEKVLFTKGIEFIQDKQGKRTDLDAIEDLLIKGWTPKQILDESIYFYKYERVIKQRYIDLRLQNAPVRQKIYCEYHVGKSGSGKTYTYDLLCEQYGADNIYVMTDFDNQASGGLDKYMEMGAPEILFMDEFKGEGLSFQKLLVMLNGYTRMQTHSRYENTYNLWTQCFITSIYPPEVLYEIMVPTSYQKYDTYKQFLRRIDKVVYHYKEDGQFKQYEIDSSEYTTYEELIQKAQGNKVDKDGFIVVTEEEDNPFN